MPKASAHTSSDFVKLILIGNSGAGKTGALASLVKAGYRLRIYDMDAGLDALVNLVRADDPAGLERIEYQTYRDRMKMTSTGPKPDGPPKAYVQLMNDLERWPDDGSDPATWGPETICVIDSLTHTARAAFLWAKASNPTAKEPRQWYHTAQGLIMDLLANLTSESFRTNVIVISHVDYVETKDGLIKGMTSSIGKAIGNKIPSFFNTLVLSELIGTGTAVKRKIKTVPTSLIDLKNPAPFRIEKEYPLETGLADLFAALRNQPK